jgi:hypothetical protein
VRLLVWGGASLLIGALVLAIPALRNAGSLLLRRFALATMVWGGGEVVLSALLWRAMELRDVGGATRYANMLWLDLGLSAGISLAGVALAGAAWRLGRHEGAAGAGLALTVQGLALAVLHARTLAALERWM